MRLRIGVLTVALGVLTVALAFFLAGCDEVVLGGWDRVQEDFHYSYPLNAGGRIEVENQNGAIEISGWDRNTVDISGTKYASTANRLREIRVDISPAPASIVVRTVRPEYWPGNGGVRYSIRVPSRTELARITSSNGAIRVDAIDGTAHLRTSNGAITATGMTGALEAETSNGAVTVTGMAGPAMLHTSNGRIELSLNSMQEVRAGTSNGAITLRLPSGAGASIRARTSNGRISSDFDVTTHGVLSKHQLEGAIGSGGPLLDLSTSNGAISILRR